MSKITSQKFADNWKKSKDRAVWEQGFNEGKKHMESSPETLKRFDDFKDYYDMKFEKIDDKLKCIEEKIPTRNDLKIAIIEANKEQQKELDEKYADKLVERIVYGVVGTVLLGAVGAILALIYK